MSQCRSCDLQRIYRQFAEKQARKEAAAKAAAQKAPEVVPVKIEDVVQNTTPVVEEVKKPTRTRKKKEELSETEGN